nr:MAG TPA: hypothetical protein [Caudoviricetes sp.]
MARPIIRERPIMRDSGRAKINTGVNPVFWTV